jgi:NTP pyrophosphatase (non-canonical NTP hydrolase)
LSEIHSIPIHPRCSRLCAVHCRHTASPSNGPWEGRHEKWCGDASLGRPVDKCTCDVTPDMQAREQAAFSSGLAAGIERGRTAAPVSIINWAVFEEYDAWLDSAVSPEYREQPLARDITRITKLFEEAGEVIKKHSEATGENPRKGIASTMEEVLDEAGDVFLTAILLIQHFTKDRQETAMILRRAMHKLEQRNADIR